MLFAFTAPGVRGPRGSGGPFRVAELFPAVPRARRPSQAAGQSATQQHQVLCHAGSAETSPGSGVAGQSYQRAEPALAEEQLGQAAAGDERARVCSCARSGGRVQVDPPPQSCLMSWHGTVQIHRAPAAVDFGLKCGSLSAVGSGRAETANSSAFQYTNRVQYTDPNNK